MSLWLLNIYMDGVVREVKAKFGKGGAEMECGSKVWWLVTSLVVNNNVLQKVVSVIYNVHTLVIEGK